MLDARRRPVRRGRLRRPARAVRLRLRRPRTRCRTDGGPPGRGALRHPAAHPHAGDPRGPGVPGRSRLGRARLPAPAPRPYVRRLNEVASTWPGGFVAHHYTRYLGDLSGGRPIGSCSRAVRVRHERRPFCIFDQLADPTAFEDTYRAQLDAAPWDAAERERVMAEVELASTLTTDCSPSSTPSATAPPPLLRPPEPVQHRARGPHAAGATAPSVRRSSSCGLPPDTLLRSRPLPRATARTR